MYCTCCVDISHCCYSMRLSVLFLVRFNNFDRTMGFYWSYTLLLKPPVLMYSCWYHQVVGSSLNLHVIVRFANSLSTKWIRLCLTRSINGFIATKTDSHVLWFLQKPPTDVHCQFSSDSLPAVRLGKLWWMKPALSSVIVIVCVYFLQRMGC